MKLLRAPDTSRAALVCCNAMNVIIFLQTNFFYIIFFSVSSASPLNMSIEEKIEADNRSVYVGNVDYGATAEELEQHFHGCGSINR